MNALLLILVSVFINVSFGSVALTRSVLTSSIKRKTTALTKTFMSSQKSNNYDGAALAKIGLGLGVCSYGCYYLNDHFKKIDENKRIELKAELDEQIKLKTELDKRIEFDRIEYKRRSNEFHLEQKRISNLISECFDAIRGEDHPDFLKKCIKSEFKVFDHRDKDGSTALQAAIEAGRAEYIQELIENGAYQHIHYNPTFYLKCAIDNYRPEILKKLSKIWIGSRVDIDGRHNRKRTFLQTAIEKGQVEIVQALIDCGADLNNEDSFGRSYLLTAAANNQKDVFDILIARGLKIKRFSKIVSVIAEIIEMALKADPAHQTDYQSMIANLFLMANCDHGIYLFLKSIEYGRDNLDWVNSLLIAKNNCKAEPLQAESAHQTDSIPPYEIPEYFKKNPLPFPDFDD